MIILTGANRDVPTGDDGRVRDDIKFTFSSVIHKTVKKAEELGYVAEVYDLGALGFGRRFSVGDESFAKLGFYDKEVVKGYKSKSLFKPKMVKSCIEEHKDFTVYLDGDALLCDDISEIDTDDYDVGITLRHLAELESEWHQDHFDIAKFSNAGVIFFRDTSGTKIFLDKWDKLTDEVGNDQMALNQLACPNYYPEAGSVITIDGVRIKYFPGTQYNYYYFKEISSSGVKIMHFKGDVRHLYPFDWKTKIYCRFIVIARSILKIFSSKKNKVDQ